jgi:hypothetical protein
LCSAQDGVCRRGGHPRGMCNPLAGPRVLDHFRRHA